MNVRIDTKKYAMAGEVVCTVEIVDGSTVIATGVSIRGGAGLAAHDGRSLREHTVYAALEAVKSLHSKAKFAEEAVLELLHGEEKR